MTNGNAIVSPVFFQIAERETKALEERFSQSYINIRQLAIPQNAVVMSYESAKIANIAN
ncbi:MAG: hypothetical protein LBK57_08245 [Clostridiales Family XIII bacterium]|jgi:hypothetical protein|nr:hypothetical protein [Clostridiales Family XIII bacterium]